MMLVYRAMPWEVSWPADLTGSVFMATGEVSVCSQSEDGDVIQLEPADFALAQRLASERQMGVQIFLRKLFHEELLKRQ